MKHCEQSLAARGTVPNLEAIASWAHAWGRLELSWRSIVPEHRTEGDDRMANHALALIVANPGPLREGLRAALAAIPPLDEVTEVDNITTAVRLFADRSPALVLVSTGSDGSNSPESCRTIKSCWPHSPCLALVDTVGLGPVARNAGADLVLVKGVRPDTLLENIEALLREGDLGLV